MRLRMSRIRTGAVDEQDIRSFEGKEFVGCNAEAWESLRVKNGWSGSDDYERQVSIVIAAVEDKVIGQCLKAGYSARTCSEDLKVIGPEANTYGGGSRICQYRAIIRFGAR